MKIRTLRRDEHGALLDLLDGWELPDGWRGRVFFRRYLEDDPAFEERNVWVAERDGRLVSCVQIFPRTLRLAGADVPTGGIGSVFTATEARGAGVAGALLEQAATAMRERGMELSLLFAARLAFYGRLGWTSWPTTRTLVRPRAAAEPQGAPPAGDAEARPSPFDPARDLEAVRAIHLAYSGALEGSAVRDTTAWQATLRLAGNPGEDFLVARRGGRVVAYARATVLSSFLVISELGRDAAQDPGAEALAALVAALLGAREPDPLARPDKPSAVLRASLAGPALVDAPLAAALRRRGLELLPVPDPSAMFRVLDAPALARRLGIPPPASDAREHADAWLRDALPSDRFVYWLADRF